MADNHPGRIADSPTASGDLAGDPSSQPKPDDNPSPVPDHDAEGDISEKDVQNILDGFAEGNVVEVEEGGGEGDPEPKPKPTEDDDPDDGEPDEIDEDDPDDIIDEEPDDSDLFDDDPDRSGNAGDQGGEGGSSNEDDEDDAEELDDVQSRLDEKSGKAFARMRVQLKEARQEAGAAKASAAFGSKMGEMIDRFGLTDEQLFNGLNLVATLQTDPIKGITLLRDHMASAATLAKERYPKVNLDELLAFDADNLTSAPRSDLPEDLQEMVDEGRMTEDRAREIATAMKRQDGGGDGAPAASTPDQIEDTNNALRSIGFYKVNTEPELDQRIEMLIPAMEKLADKLGLDLPTLSHSARKELAVRAGKAVLQRISKGTKSKPKKGRMLRAREGGTPRQQQGDHKTWDDVSRAVMSGFSQG